MPVMITYQHAKGKSATMSNTAVTKVSVDSKDQ